MYYEVNWRIPDFQNLVSTYLDISFYDLFGMRVCSLSSLAQIGVVNEYSIIDITVVPYRFIAITVSPRRDHDKRLV